MEHFLAKQWRRSRAQKRGGHFQFISLDQLEPEERYRLEPHQTTTAAEIYERRWALTILENGLKRLEDEAEASGNVRQFRHLKDFLTGGSGELSHAEIGKMLDMSPGAVKTAIYRWRRRFADVIRMEVAQTVGDEEQIDEEIRHLHAVLRGP